LLWVKWLGQEGDHSPPSNAKVKNMWNYKSRRINGRDMWHAWRRREMFTGFWFGGLKGRPRCRWEDNIKMDLRERGINGAFGLLRTGSSGGLL
jgi:hypothetical protein